MSKSIKLQDDVYSNLDQARGKGETFSQVVDRLLDLRLMLLLADPILRGQKAYQEWKDAKKREEQAASQRKEVS